MVLASGQAERERGSLRLLHHHAGYVRVQADLFVDSAGDEGALADAHAATSAVPGVHSWTHNPRTGSVVVTYDPAAVEADDLVNHIAKHAGLRGVATALPRKASRQDVVSAVLDAVQDVNGVVRQLTGERADLRELVPFALAVSSVVSFILHEHRGRLPHWGNALYHSYRVFMHWHRPEIRARERVARQHEAERAGDLDQGGDAR